MLLDGSEMDSFADLTHTPQGDVKNEAMFSLLPKFKNLTHTPQGDVKNEAMFSLLPKFKNLTHTPQGDVSLKWPKFFLFGLGFNPHPARGRKPNCSDEVYPLSLI